MLQLGLTDAVHFQSLLFSYTLGAAGVNTVNGPTTPKGVTRIVLAMSCTHNGAASHYLRMITRNSVGQAVHVPGSVDTVALPAGVSNVLLRPIIVPEDCFPQAQSSDAIGAAENVDVRLWYFDVFR